MYQYRDCKKCSKNIENWQCPMMVMMEEEEDDRDLEAMYPKVYFATLPMVRKHIDRMEEKHGEMHTPRKEEIEEMLDNILNDVGPDVENMMRDEMDEGITRQIPGRRGLRDLLGILFIDELRGRRRRRRRRRRPYPPYGGRPGQYGGYPQYPGYPGYQPYQGY